MPIYQSIMIHILTGSYRLGAKGPNNFQCMISERANEIKMNNNWTVKIPNRIFDFLKSTDNLHTCFVLRCQKNTRILICASSNGAPLVPWPFRCFRCHSTIVPLVPESFLSFLVLATTIPRGVELGARGSDFPM